MPDRTLNLDDWQTTERGVLPLIPRPIWVEPVIPALDPIIVPPRVVQAALPGMPTLPQARTVPEPAPSILNSLSSSVNILGLNVPIWLIIGGIALAVFSGGRR